MLRRLNLILAWAGFALVGVTIVIEADTSIGVFAVPAVGFFIALAAASYALLGALSRRLVRPLPLAICTIGLIALSVFWVWAFGAVFWWNEQPDAQDGIALVVFPALMIAGSGVLALAAGLIERYL